jgi:hypothetical protein
MGSYLVPFVTQQVYRNQEWRRFGCGIASLKMVFDYWQLRNPDNRTDDADNLYATGLDSGAFDPAVGWLHAGLVDLATSLGYESYRLDFGPRSGTPLPAEDALAELTRELAGGPVIASVYRDFDVSRGGGHLVVVTDVTGDAVCLNDPEPAQESDGRRVLSQRDFLPAFKSRFIVVRPRA